MDTLASQQASLVEKVLRWRPAVEATTNLAPDVVGISITATRDAILQAAPRSDEDLGALGALFRFFVWCSESGTTPIRDSLTYARIDEYIDDAMKDTPTGTRNATRSRLRCCIPGSSFAGRAGLRTRSSQPVMPDAQRDQPTDTPTVERAKLSEPMKALINEWTPKWSHRPEWAVIEPVVHAAVCEASPGTAAVAEVWLREAGKLGAWLVHNGYPLQTVDALLNADRCEEYLTALRKSRVSEGSIATYRSTLNTIRKRRDEVGLPQPADPFQPADGLESSYTPEELHYFATMCDSARSKSQRRHLTSLYMLVLFGAAGSGSEVGCVMPDDITRTEDGLGQVAIWGAPEAGRLRTPRRVVTIADRHVGDRLMTLAAQAADAGDRFMIGGNERDDTRGRRSSELTANTKRWAPPLDLKKLRTTGLRLRLQKVLPEIESLQRALGASNAEEFMSLVKLAARPTLGTGTIEGRV